MSEVSKPFPLFRLPVVPLTKISRFMHLREILLISLTSKKSAFIMKSLLPLNSFYLQMRFSEKSEIFLGVKGFWAPLTVKVQLEDNLFNLQVTQPPGDVSYQWAGRELQEPVELLLTHFATVFNPTISIHVEKIYSQEFVMAVLHHVTHLNLVKKSIILHRINLSPENYKCILEACKEAPELLIHCKVASDFEYRVEPDFRVDDFSVTDGHWMHLEDFSNCRKVTVSDSSEREYEFVMYQKPDYKKRKMLRAFIRKWIETDCRLEHIKVDGGSVGVDFRELLAGIEHITIDTIWRSAEITRRSDGKKATVKAKLNYFELKVID